MELKVMQYLRPDGRQRQISIDLPAELDEKINQILSKRLEFSAEQLNPEQVALYISDPENEEDLVCEFATNGPGDNSPKNVLIEMIKRFKP